MDQLLHLDQEATALVGKEWWPGKVIEVLAYGRRLCPDVLSLHRYMRTVL